jgi:hypothetical protein
MISVPTSVRVWLAVGRTDMRRGMNGLALQVQEPGFADAAPLICPRWKMGLRIARATRSLRCFPGFPRTGMSSWIGPPVLRFFDLRFGIPPEQNSSSGFAASSASFEPAPA